MFKSHYDKWSSQMESAELELKEFAQTEVKNCGTNVAAALLFLNRLDCINLKCFHLEQRYFEVGIAFLEELKSLKDT